MTDYEIVALLHPRLDETGVEQLNAWVQKRITDLNGEVLEVKSWGRRPLAYPVRKQEEATYVQYDFRLDGKRLAELTRSLRLHEDILRHLAVRKSDH